MAVRVSARAVIIEGLGRYCANTGGGLRFCWRENEPKVNGLADGDVDYISDRSTVYGWQCVEKCAREYDDLLTAVLAVCVEGGIEFSDDKVSGSAIARVSNLNRFCHE
ncbi:hypothetical protein [Paenibacillus durus]|uniref:hypothetical protein n=1 Tax=Paenibacillus durus TaxID=44251 RepID=UPI0012DF8D2A|nr:hypothetical protein [Paenibacillus durus]